MSKTGWLIYKKKDAERNHGFIEMLIAEAKNLHITLHLVFEEDLTYGIFENKLAVLHPALQVENIHFAIVRTINPLLTKQFEYMGIRCFNRSSVSEICNDKARTYQFMLSLGVPTLNSYFITYDSNISNIPFTFPMVLKQADGRGGKEVYLVESIEEITEQLQEAPHKRFVLQDFNNNPGKDIRVFVIGSNVIGAVLRESTTSFKANYTLGGSVRPYHLNSEEMHTVQKIASALQGDFIGIDFLLNRNNKLIFNEVEDIVGCRSLYATSQVNPAALYLEYIQQNI